MRHPSAARCTWRAWVQERGSARTRSGQTPGLPRRDRTLVGGSGSEGRAPGPGSSRCLQAARGAEAQGKAGLTPPAAAYLITFLGFLRLLLVVFTFCSFWLVCLFKGR